MGGAWETTEQTLPVPLIQVNADGSSKGARFKFNEEGVEKYFLAKDVSGLKIAVISVAGMMRAGKSFLISFFLRYAMYMYQDPETRVDLKESWMGNDESELTGGFKWRGSVKRQTNGILMWPILFKCTLKSGEKICLMILDTQGTHDGETTSSLWAGVFAVSTLISSVQMYNVMRNVGEEELENLEFFCGYGKLIAEVASNSNPYQNLMFVVRDFKFGKNYEFGLKGGESYLQDRVIDMIPFSKQSQEVRKNITGFFENLSCCLLPDPGIRVMEQSNFNGKMKEIDQRFKDVLREFVPKVLTPDNLVLKHVHGKLLTTQQLFQFIKVWVDNLNDASLPEPKTLFKATAQAAHVRAMEEALAMYTAKMEAVNCTGTVYVDTEKLEATHILAQDWSIEHFLTKPKIGKDGEMTEMYQAKLEECIQEKYAEYSHQNAVRIQSIGYSVRTPITTFVGVFILTGLEMIGFEKARWVKLVMLAVLLLWIKDVIFRGIKKIEEKRGAAK